MLRLLCADANDSFCLSEHLDDDIPPFAILSHTWGADHEEVTYQDVVNGIGKEKLGYQKLQFCANKAKEDHLRFFWIDTCCINKTSSAELSEAITSMFRWYSDATVCYVFLPDILMENFEHGLPACRWFTRGWTLQELIAPRTVLFFAADGMRVGDKSSLCQQLHDITGIPVSALQGEDLENFSVTERMQWAANRRTQRPEDAVYCLLGLFDISIPIIYGEGHKKAMKRLRRELQFALVDTNLYGVSLYEAVRRGELTAVDLILQDGVSVDYVHSDDRREAVLHAAVRSSSFKVLQSVLAAKPKLDPYSGEVLTPLMLAAVLGDEFAVALLLDAGCALDLGIPSRRKLSFSTIDMGEDQFIPGSTALYLAAQTGRYRAAKVLLDRGAQINAKTRLGFTPLVAASYHGHLDCVELLLENGADLEAQTHDDFTALIYSAQKGHIKIASVLLDAGANIEAKKDGAMSPLLEAAYWSQIEFAKFIIGRGANPAAQSDWDTDELFGATALHFAVHEDNLRMIEVLVQCGVPLDTRNRAGETAEECARQLGHDRSSEKLKSLS